MKSDPGTYVLILRSSSKATVQVGQWGQITLKKGYYIYVGSAFGPGGVQARVSRHFRKNKPTHWHIDYLRKFLNPVAVWYTHNPERLEHKWAQFLSNLSGITSIQRFGCSDCNCQSHLFYSHSKPDAILFSNVIGNKVQVWVKIHAGFRVEQTH